MTLFVHETHRVVGAKEDEFEAACRDLMAALASGPDGRLLGYWVQAHGTGPSYRVVTLTALDGWAAWERLARSPVIADHQARLDGLRHDVESAILEPLPWSPLHTLDLAAVPADAVDGPRTLLMEDTMWPHRGRMADYLANAGDHYTALLSRPESLLRLDLAVTAVVGDTPTVVLFQTVKDPRTVVRLFATELGPERRPPGSWMHDALEWRDQWRSRMLRAAPWAPWSKVVA